MKTLLFPKSNLYLLAVIYIKDTRACRKLYRHKTAIWS